jgi:predicted HAD superfamily Cof-like phosphohydrolase
MSQTDSNSQESDFQDDVSAISAHVSESSIDNETEEEMDPWIPLIEEAKQRSNIAFEEMTEILINSGLDEQSAKDKACSNILPKLRKELENIYMERLVWMST